MASSSSSSDMVEVLSRVTFDVQRSHQRHAIVHLARERRGGQFISGADRIFQQKPAIYGPGGPYISGDHIFRDRPASHWGEPERAPHSRDLHHFFMYVCLSVASCIIYIHVAVDPIAYNRISTWKTGILRAPAPDTA